MFLKHFGFPTDGYVDKNFSKTVLSCVPPTSRWCICAFGM